ncbi:hypothetical protein [Caldimonas brevitalea]|uniref:hypothetical protein n=1 Tax=Caldimonas brevitalea TaxID=413882 RepID=UPI0012FCC41C|nr:hypothetical protein [Caldimonas brevitalea]
MDVTARHRARRLPLYPSPHRATLLAWLDGIVGWDARAVAKRLGSPVRQREMSQADFLDTQPDWRSHE